MSIILILLSLSVIFTYVGVMICREGIPYSISATYYSLKHKAWFGITMWLTSLLLLPAILDRTPESIQFSAFGMCAGLLFVGAAPNFREEYENGIHVAGTCVSAICSQIWVAVLQPWLLLIWAAWVIYVIVRMKRVWNGDLWSSFVMCKPLFWAEVIAFGMVYIILLFDYIV